MDFRTNKCNHGQKGMCIHCMVNRHKHQKKGIKQQQTATSIKCKHPSHMKCLRCMTPQQQKNSCKHPDYQKCAKCQHFLKYDKFLYALQKLARDCIHKKPCLKCVPPLSRKTYFVDTSCRKHLPYPQAMCEACMAPTVTVSPQSYAHVSQVIIKTMAVNQIAESKLFGILLGHYQDDVAIVQDVYFPQNQSKSSGYIDPDSLPNRSYLFDYFNLTEIGLIYEGHLSGMQLMISSLFQQKYIQSQDGHQFSRFITMRLHLDLQLGQPHFECYMVSDQMQAFHRWGLLFESQEPDCFQMITSKCQKSAQKPTFLRGGIQTDKLFFKQCLVWIPTVPLQSYISRFYYPFFTLQQQSLREIKSYIRKQGDSLEKYRNLQMLLHLQKLVGSQNVSIFLNNFLLDSPDIFLKERVKEIQKNQDLQIRSMYSDFQEDQQMYQELP